MVPMVSIGTKSHWSIAVEPAAASWVKLCGAKSMKLSNTGMKKSSPVSEVCSDEGNCEGISWW